MNEVPKQIRIQIVQQELQMWANTRWQLEMRHRVTKRIGGDVKAITDDLVKAEGAIAELETILQETKKLPDVSVLARAEQALAEADAMLKKTEAESDS